MDEKKEISECLSFGKKHLNVTAFVGQTKKQFVEKYQGKVDFDLDNAWFCIEQRLNELGLSENSKHKKNKQDESAGTTGKEAKTTDAKAPDAGVEKK